MRVFAVVALLIAVAVACVPKLGSDVTTDAETMLCPAGVPGAAQCADASNDMLGIGREFEQVTSHEFTMIDTYPKTMRETRALAHAGGDKHDDLFGHETMKGSRGVGVRAGRPSGAYILA